MSVDRISYRIPGKEIIQLEGSIIPLSGLENYEGFILSDFLGTAFYGISTSKKSINSINQPIPFCISKDEYLQQATVFIDELKNNNIGKAILSRVKKVSSSNQPNELFQKMLQAYPSAFCYSIESAVLGTWVGATPEKLIHSSNGIATTMALASTKSSNDESQWGEKEVHEQGLVKEFIQSTLERFADEMEVSEREELIAGPVKHLVNYFEFKLSQDQLSKLLGELHPTPAVSGFPKKEALELIASTEKHSRNLYAGIIGITSPTTSSLFVNLRCCQFIDSNYYLYLGGGITQESIPENEWQETENKALTILNLLSR